MLIPRIGTFFILLGALLVALFVFSDLAQAPDANLLIVGGLSLLFGIILRVVKPPPPPEESGRFRVIKRFSRKSKSGAAGQGGGLRLFGRRKAGADKNQEGSDFENR